MAQPVIRVEGVSKKYHVAQQSEANYRTLGETLSNLATAPLRRLRAGGNTEPEPAGGWGNYSESKGRRRTSRFDSGKGVFWALRDVSFDIEEGAVTGLIGVNGAGKSTLLKILSHITAPTTGRSGIRGRVASLLEVGTGFHGELSGRENILLNGAILGMKRHETLKKFDEIVAFAGVEEFVDTPVKRYSSGMYLRLAFAVAAHLDPEVLLVDEVLAVGDIAFQRRCMGRMREVSQEGRTVILVSHSMVSIEALCDQCLLLDAGRLAQIGPTPEITKEYRRRLQGNVDANGTNLARHKQSQEIFTSVSLIDANNEATRCFPLGGAVRLRITLDLPALPTEPEVVLRFNDAYDQRVMTLKTPASMEVIRERSGKQVLECTIPEFPLVPGEYWVGLGLYVNKNMLDSVDRAINFTVINSNYYGSGRGASSGVCIARTEWRTLSPVEYSPTQKLA